MTDSLLPLSGRGKRIVFRREGAGYHVRWGKTPFRLSDGLLQAICSDFFRDPGAWYPLGSSADRSIPGGLGEFVASRVHGLTPRHASAIAPILVHQGLLEWRGAKPIELRRAGSH